MNTAFEKFYETCFVGGVDNVEHRLYYFWPAFFETSKEHLKNIESTSISLHDDYFSNFTAITESFWQRGFSEQVCRMWAKIAEFIKEFETENYVLHKGSLFYFWSIPLIMVERTDAGILALNKAVIEDQRSKPNDWKNNPAHQILTLNSQSDTPYLKELLVDPAVDFIEKRIAKYKLYSGRDFSYHELQSKFLENEDLELDMRYYFTLAIYKLQYLRRLSKLGLGQKTIGPLVLNVSLGSMLMLWENLLKLRYGDTNLMSLVASSLDDTGLKWGNSTTRAQNANRDANRNFERFIKHRVGKNLRQDLLVGYALRNQSFHSLSSMELLWDNHTELIQAVLNCIFTALKPEHN